MRRRPGLVEHRGARTRATFAASYALDIASTCSGRENVDEPSSSFASCHSASRSKERAHKGG